MDQVPKLKRPTNPRNNANILSIITFGYAIPLFYKGFFKNVDNEDMPDIRSCHSATQLGNRLDKCWQIEQSKQVPTLWKAIARGFGLELFVLGFGLCVVDVFLKTVRALALIGMVKYYSENTNKSDNLSYVYICGGIIVTTSFLSILLFQLISQELELLGMKIRIALTSLIYRKVLKLNKAALSNVTVGHITNLLTNDVAPIEQGILYLSFLWISPLGVIVMTAILYHLLGLLSIVGLVFVILLVPIQIFLANKSANFHLKLAFMTDERVRLMNEIVSGIKVIKMYTWEQPFETLIGNIRRLEVRQISALNNIKVCVLVLINAPKFAIFLAIVAYSLTGNKVTALYAFTVTSFYADLKMLVFVYFVRAMDLLAKMLISTARFQKLLIAEEVTRDSNILKRATITNKSFRKNENMQIIFQEVTAQWNQNDPIYTLNQITLSIEDDNLIGIIGPVGSGKSSILLAILNEIPLKSGSVSTKGKISYASQEPWVFSGNMQQNILFGQEMDANRYYEVLKVCALDKDVCWLPYGDKTLVGEKGVLLSGGQKARVNLARAIYNKADIYLLDDPLSSVDSHVGKYIFEQCIRNFLSNKCVLLVTHQYQFLNNFSYIYLLEKGEIAARGTYAELTVSNVWFQKQLQNNDDSDRLAYNKMEKRSSSRVMMTLSPTNVTTEKSKDFSYNPLLTYLRGGSSIVIKLVALLLMVFAQASYAASDYFLAYWVVQEQKGTNEYTEKDFESIYTGIACAMTFLDVLACYTFFKMCTQISIGIHDNMFKSVINTSINFFHTNYSGRILNRFSKDIRVIDESIPDSSVHCCLIVLILLGSVVIVSINNPSIIISTFVVFILFYFARIVYLKTSRNVRRLEGSARSPLFGHINDTIQGLSTIRALNSQKVLQNEFDCHQDYHSSVSSTFIIGSKMFGYYIDIIIVLHIAILIFAILIQSPQSAGNVGLAITQSINLLKMLQFGLIQSAELENHMTSVERITEYTNMESEDARERYTVVDNWPNTGTIRFKSVSLKYSPDQLYVLKNLSFRIESNQKVGIVGRTGAGKSSLISIIFQLNNSEGTVIIDDVDIVKTPLRNLRSKISIIPQDPVLFSGTIRHNLDPFGLYSDEILWLALEQVQLKSFITNLPLGLDHLVSDGATNFSVGQKQLLCLSRAIIRKNKILILDEATANVDPDTDLLIQKTIRQTFSNCTILTVAHRLNTIMDSDKVLVMENGEIVEYDHPYVLLKNINGAFHLMLQKTGRTNFTLLSKIAENNYKKTKMYGMNNF